MATPDVFTTHQDGGLGNSDYIPDRLHAKIGAAETGDQDKVYLIRNYPQAKTIFAKGALLDSIRQHFEEFNEDLGQRPQPVLAIRPANDQAGSVGAPVKTGTGAFAVPTTAGTPTGDRVVVLKITKEGAHGVAEYRRSTDGGATFEAPVVTPASGQPISLAVGVTATFTDDATPADTFDVGDTVTIPITGPTPSNAARLDSLDALKQEYRLFWVHILGGADRAFGISVSQVLTEMETDHHLPAFAILEAMPKTTGTVAEYLQSVMDEWDPFVHSRVGIVAAEGRYIAGGIKAFGGYAAVYDKGDTVGEWRNAATLLCAKIAAGAPNVSPGWVERMRSLTVSEVRYWNAPDGETESYQDYMDPMHDLGLTVLKQYDDYEGIFLAGGRIKAAADSDFRNIPERRRADKMHRIVYQTSLPFLQMDTEAKSGSGGLEYIQAKSDQAVADRMESPGRAEISGHEIVLDPEGTFDQSPTEDLVVDLVMFTKKRVPGIRWRTSFAPISAG